MQNTPLHHQNTTTQESGTRAQRRKAKQKEIKKEMWAWIRELAAIVIIVVIIKSFLFSIITVQGDSMKDTLLSGDRLYVSLLTPRINGYERGDVIICFYPGRTDRCVKRIVGLPGETVNIQSGTVYVNGLPLEEDYLDYTASYNYPSITLEEGEYFVLGDNRPISHDSHSFDVGPVTNIEGKVRFRIWPLNRIGSIE